MKQLKVSNNVIRRLPRYLRKLDGSLKTAGVDRISSGELGRQMSLTSSQIRQDFSCFGEFGQQGYGYNVTGLRGQIASILGINRRFFRHPRWRGQHRPRAYRELLLRAVRLPHGRSIRRACPSSLARISPESASTTYQSCPTSLRPTKSIWPFSAHLARFSAPARQRAELRGALASRPSGTSQTWSSTWLSPMS